jgi:hypothetical protein
MGNQILVRIQSKNSSKADPSFENFDSTVIDEMEVMLHAGIKERLANVTQSRETLTQCVQIMDGMVRSHSLRTDDGRKEMKERDDQHESEVRTIDFTEELQNNRLKQELAEV